MSSGSGDGEGRDVIPLQISPRPGQDRHTGRRAGSRRQAGDHGGHCHIYSSALPNGGEGGGMGGVFSSVFRFFGVRMGLSRVAVAGSSSTSRRRLERVTMEKGTSRMRTRGGPAGFDGRPFVWRAGGPARDCCRLVSPRCSKGGGVCSMPPRLRFAVGAADSLLTQISPGDAARLERTSLTSAGDMDRGRDSFDLPVSSFSEGLVLLCRDAMGLEGPEAVTP